MVVAPARAFDPQEDKDIAGFWKVWSKAIERGFLQYTDISNVFDRKAKCRGEPTFPKRKRKADHQKKGETKQEASRAPPPRTRSSKPGDANGWISGSDC